MPLSVFGFQDKVLEPEEQGLKFIEQCLRIPKSLLKNDCSVIQTMLAGIKKQENPAKKLQKNSLPLTCYIKTTNKALKSHIDYKTSKPSQMNVN
jgi:hypothetical protein